MKIVIAPNAFKESMNSVEAASAMREGVNGSCYDEIELVPIGDGGDGTLEALKTAVGGRLLHFNVHDPLGNIVRAPILLLGNGKAFVEMAKASGLALVPPHLRNPMHTTSLGTGELIQEAISAGAREIILGVGGSATVDGGLGALQALGFKFVDAHGEEVGRGGKGLLELERIIEPDFAYGGIKFRIMVDVQNPLLGPEGAAAVYGPQKGASDSDVAELESGLKKLASLIMELKGIDVSEVNGGGAAGGIAASFHGLLGASIENGAELFLELVDFDNKLVGADLVLTGEGKLDRQTAYGKGVSAVAAHASAHDVPVAAFGGIIEDRDILHRAGVTALFSIVDRPELPLDEALKHAKELLTTSVREVVRLRCAYKEHGKS